MADLFVFVLNLCQFLDCARACLGWRWRWRRGGDPDLTSDLAPKQAELTWRARRLRQSSYRRRRGRLSLATAMVVVRSCLPQMGSVLGGAKNCVLSAEDAEGRGEYLFVHEGTRRTEKALGGFPLREWAAIRLFAAIYQGKTVIRQTVTSPNQYRELLPGGVPAADFTRLPAGGQAVLRRSGFRLSWTRSRRRYAPGRAAGRR